MRKIGPSDWEQGLTLGEALWETTPCGWRAYIDPPRSRERPQRPVREMKRAGFGPDFFSAAYERQQYNAFARSDAGRAAREAERRVQNERQYHRLKLLEVFKARLVEGELFATGVQKPRTLSSVRIVIPAPAWKTLRPNYAVSTAKLDETEVVEILVFRDLRDARRDVGEEEATPAPTLEGAPRGRKTEPKTKRTEIMDAYDELRRTGAVNLGHGQISAAVRLLHEQFPDYQRDSIRRILTDYLRDEKAKRLG